MHSEDINNSEETHPDNVARFIVNDEKGEFMSENEEDQPGGNSANDSASSNEYVPLFQRMQEQNKYMAVDPKSLEFVERMKKEHPEWYD